LKCLLIREKVLSPNHKDIGASLSNIGTCYEQLDQLKMALEYYKRALIVYEQCPYAFGEQWRMEENIERLSEILNNQHIE